MLACSALPNALAAVSAIVVLHPLHVPGAQSRGGVMAKGWAFVTTLEHGVAIRRRPRRRAKNRLQDTVQSRPRGGRATRYGRAPCARRPHRAGGAGMPAAVSARRCPRTALGNVTLHLRCPPRRSPRPADRAAAAASCADGCAADHASSAAGGAPERGPAGAERVELNRRSGAACGPSAPASTSSCSTRLSLKSRRAISPASGPGSSL